MILAIAMGAACPSPPRAVDAGMPALDVLPTRVVDAGVTQGAGVGLAAPDDTRLWQELRRRCGEPTIDALRSCASSDECATLFHFTRCCDHLSVKATHRRVLERARTEITRDHQTPDELRLCEIASCSGVLPPSTCAAGRCVVDGERPLWLDVARVTSTPKANVDAMRACAKDDDCVIVPHPTQCCRAAAVARLYERAVKASQATLMPADEVRKCAIKDCAIRGDAVCVEGLCRIGSR